MITKELLEYIKSQRVLGKKEEEIRQGLLSSGGWLASDLDEAFRVSSVPISPSKTFEKTISQSNLGNRKTLIITSLALIIIFLVVTGIYAYRTGHFPFLEISNPNKMLAPIDSSSETLPIIQPSNQTETKSVTDNINTKDSIKYPDLFIGGSESVKINPDKEIGYNIQVNEGSTLMFMIGWSGEGLTVNLTDSQGNNTDLTANEPVDTSSKIGITKPNPIFLKEGNKYSLLYNLPEQIMSGNWKLIAKNSGKNIVDFSITTIGSSNIMIIPQPDLIRLNLLEDFIVSVFIGEKILNSSTSKPFTPLLNMNINAMILDDKQNVIKTVSLSDGIVNGAGISGDGIYISSPINNLPSGEYSVSYTVQGKNLKDQPIARKSNLSGEKTFIDVSTGNAQIFKIEDEGLDINGDGLSGVIQVGFWLSAKKEGKYNLSATFISPNKQEIPVSSQFSLVGGGQAEKQNLLLNFNDHVNQMTNGVYKIKDIYLFENINNRTTWVDTWVNDGGIYTTKNYKVK